MIPVTFSTPMLQTLRTVYFRFQNGVCVFEPIIFGVWVAIMTGYSVSCFFFFYVFPVIAFFFFYGAVVYTLKKRQVGILISAYSSVKVRIAYDDVVFFGENLRF